MIYYVVICGTLFFGNLKRYLNSTDMRTGIKWSVVQWIELLLTAVLISLPFHLQFKSVMVQGIENSYGVLSVLCIMGFSIAYMWIICRIYADKK